MDFLSDLHPDRNCQPTVRLEDVREAPSNIYRRYVDKITVQSSYDKCDDNVP